MGEPTSLRNFSFPILGKATKRDAPALSSSLIFRRFCAKGRINHGAEAAWRLRFTSLSGSLTESPHAGFEERWWCTVVSSCAMVARGVFNYDGA